MSSTKRNASTAFRDAVNADHHTMKLGENGMPEYTDFGVGSKVLAISQQVRGGDPSSLANEILDNENASIQDIVDLIVLAFATRNCRGGKGEKDLSFDIFLRVWKKFPETSKSLMELWSHYGCWKDLLKLMVMASEDITIKGLDDVALEIMARELKKDMAALSEYKAVMDTNPTEKPASPKLSLLAKWLPREDTHFDKKLSFVKRFSEIMWPDLCKVVSSDGAAWKSAAKSKYRKTVAELTSQLQLPEVLLSAKREDEIQFGKVASKATMVLTKTFLNENKDGTQRSTDPKRIRMTELFVEHLTTKGLKGKQIMPHEIVGKIIRGRNITTSEELVLDAQWKDLWKGVVDEVKAKAAAEGIDFDPTRMVPLSDVSGSMSGTPMEVAIALGIGISEITHDAFKHMVLTFESQPRWHRLNPTDSIVKKVRSLQAAPWGGSTNFLGAFKLILDVCQKHNLRKEDMPSLIVFSDMQFNAAHGIYGQYGYSYGYDDASAVSKMQGVLDEIKALVAKTAAALAWTDADPTPIVFWNLRNTGGHPVNKSAEGAVLLSGFSPSLLKLVMNGEALKEEEVEIVNSDGTVTTEKIRVTPEQVLRKMLADEMYDPVREILISSGEGILLEYGALEKEERAAEKKMAAKDNAEDDSGFMVVE